MSFDKMLQKTNLLAGLTNGYPITNGIWTLEVRCTGTNYLNEQRWYLIRPEWRGERVQRASLAVDGVTLVTNTFGTAKEAR